MADYNKQTVAQLRQLLKDRGIPSTGLTRKAQIVEKLQEADSAVVDASDGQDAPGPVLVSEQVPGPVVVAPVHDSDDVSASAPVPVPVPASAPDSIAEEEHSAEESGAMGPVDAEEVLDSTVAEPIENETEDAKEEVPEADELPDAKEDAPAVDELPDAPVVELTAKETDDARDESLAADELPDAPVAELTRLQEADDTNEEAPEADELPDAPRDATPSKDVKDVQVEERGTSVQQEQPSVEQPDTLAPPEQSAQTSRLNTEELEADSRKRKRRSHSPDQPLQDITAKKRRPSLDTAPEVHLKEDDDFVMHSIQPEDNVVETLTAESESKREKKENVSRYKDLVKTDSEDTPMEAITDDRPTVPALHPVTAALYIRNFMRPLRPELLRAHLASLALPPSASPDTSIVKALFLDAMKTHALVLFSSTTAASRVRASLHGSIWPPEGNRKELWVDFIPDDRVEDWIKEEEDAILADKEARAAGRSTLPKRFEVTYTSPEDGSTTAMFQQVGGPRTSIHVHRPSAQPLPTPTLPSADTRHDIEASFKTLDELYSSTVAKPQLFFLPVSDEISDRRLKELDLETSRDWAPEETRRGRGIKMEMKYKYSFDAEDRIVEVGEDRGPWSEGYAGRGGFRGRARGRGGYRGSGDGWRG